MKTLCLAAHYPPYHAGGYGAVAHAFCDGLVRRKHEVTVLTRKPSGVAVGPVPGLPVVRTLESVTPEKLFRSNAANVAAVREAMQRLKPDVIFSCGSDGIGFSAYHAAISSRIASLTYLGDTWLSQAWRCLARYDPWVDVATGGRRPGFRRMLKRSLGYAGQLRGLLNVERPPVFAPITVISQFVLDDLKSAMASGGREPPDSAPSKKRIRGLTPPARLGLENVPFTYVPLHHAYFNSDGESIGHDGLRTSTLRALFVSRVEKLKGPDVAIAAVAEAVKNGVNVTLTIAGMRIDEMRGVLESLAQSLGIRDRVTFAGTPELPELIKLYRSHDVFLFPSRIVEGLGMVNCEAQACGLPIIGTADSGASEVIHHGKTGFRVPINDHEAMAKHLGELANDRDLWQRLSANALKSAKRFHPEAILDTLEAALLAQVRR